MFLKPDYNLKNIYEIDFAKLKEQGIKCLMFDLDSTVMVSKSSSFLPETVEWFNTFIKDFEVIADNKQNVIRVSLKYGANKEKVISGIKRISKPGLRVYSQKDQLPRVLGGLGIAVISTSQGLMTDKAARKAGLGGEVLAYVW